MNTATVDDSKCKTCSVSFLSRRFLMCRYYCVFCNFWWSLVKYSINTTVFRWHDLQKALTSPPVLHMFQGFVLRYRKNMLHFLVIFLSSSREIKPFMEINHKVCYIVTIFLHTHSKERHCVICVNCCSLGSTWFGSWCSRQLFFTLDPPDPNIRNILNSECSLVGSCISLVWPIIYVCSWCNTNILQLDDR